MAQPVFPAYRCATLVDLLRWRAQEMPGATLYTYLNDGETEEIHLSYAELDRRARAIAAWLQDRSLAGERALLLYPPGLDYIAAYFGCLYAGITAVPAYPPRLNRPAPRIQGIVADCAAAVALTTTDILASMEQRFEHAPDLKALRWCDTQTLPPGGETAWQPPAIDSDSLAFLQYTSGSTSQPKGVMVTHRNLLHNLESIRTGFRLPEGVVGVIWLPSYHDMGLIGGVLSGVYQAGRIILMSPFFFLQRPLRWLEAISRYRGQASGGPNFAYELCVDRIRPEQKEGLDLSSWQFAFSGAEPVRPGTLARFADAFAGCGFRPESYYPCYGLAEATLFVTGGDGPARPRVWHFSRQGLEQNLVQPADPGAAVPGAADPSAADPSASVPGAAVPGAADAQALVSCGHTRPDQELVIVDPYTLAPCPPERVGEIWVSGPSVAQGYWNRPQESAHSFGARLEGHAHPFLRTGDLGFVHQGELFVTGRLKDLIIIRGSNHYPQDIELTVAGAHPGLQPDAAAVFTVLRAGEEHLVVVQEVTRQARSGDPAEMIRAVRAAVSEEHDLQTAAVVLIRPLSIPKTSSGKIQRHAARSAFLEGSLEVVGEWRSPALLQDA